MKRRGRLHAGSPFILHFTTPLPFGRPGRAKSLNHFSLVTARGKVVNPDQMTAHLQRAKYGSFWLTDAIRPSAELEIVPEEGFRIDTYCDARNRLAVPVLAASVSREKLFDLFLTVLEPLGDVVDVVLETSHRSPKGRHRDIGRDDIDLPVLMSHFCDFEDLLLNDGCTGVAVISRREAMEVQFDEHKSLLIYAPDLEPFADIVRFARVRRNDRVRLLSEAVHLHQSDPRHQEAFRELCWRLGVGEAAKPVVG